MEYIIIISVNYISLDTQVTNLIDFMIIFCEKLLNL